MLKQNYWQFYVRSLAGDDRNGSGGGTVEVKVMGGVMRHTPSLRKYGALRHIR